MQIKKLGDDILRQKSLPLSKEEINDDLRNTIAQMFETMQKAQGIGLAGPQVGILKRFFIVIADDDVKRVYINPQIIATSQKLCDFEEGCLSLPKIYETIKRPESITVQALDEHGKRFTQNVAGLLARIIQHESDHLEGILFIDKGSPDFAKRANEIMQRREKKALLKEKQKQAKEQKIQAKKNKNRI